MISFFGVAEEVGELGEDIAEDFKGALVGFKTADEVRGVMLK